MTRMVISGYDFFPPVKEIDVDFETQPNMSNFFYHLIILHGQQLFRLYNWTWQINNFGKLTVYLNLFWNIYKLKYLHHFVFQSLYPTFNIYSILIPWTKDYSKFSS
jgi:hypothetical protein